MNRDEDTIMAAAAAWHAASADDAMDWDGFTAWLEADPRHRDAYDAVALADSLIDEHRETLREPAPIFANDDDQPASAVTGPAPMAARRGWMRWAGVAMAASLVAVLAIPQYIASQGETWRTDGASRTIALDDGSTVLLAPHSSLVVKGRQQDRMALSGGAWFDIRHDPARPLAITAGGIEIGDIGTRFDVQATGGQVRVAVAEGEVQVAAAALSRPIRLAAGRRLLYDGKGGSALVQSVAPRAIGEWRSGRLSFDAAPLALVAADLSRYAGVEVAVDAGLRDRQFSGTLVTSDGEAALRDLSRLMEVELRRGPAGFVLGQRR